MAQFRQTLGMSKYKNGRLIRRLLLLGTCATLIYIIITSSASVTVHTPSAYDDIKENSPLKLGGRAAKKVSPFHWIANRRNKALAQTKKRNSSIAGFLKSMVNWSDFEDPELQLLSNWDRAPIAEKCKYMIDVTYAINEGWTNSVLVNQSSDDELDDLLISLMGERLRMYDYCFITGKLRLQEVFEIDSVINLNNKDKSSSEDFLNRVFPFLKSSKDTKNDFLWPQITNLETGVVEPMPELPQNFNQDIWDSWKNFSHGRGIVITLSEKSKSLLFKQLAVLDHNGNTLPIQIVTAGNEFSPEFKKELITKVQISNQRVSLVDCAPVLDSEFAKKYIRNVINKWLAVIFNTFEEVVLLDVDAVPFVPIENFLNDESYKKSGILMYKDRNMPREHTFQYCVDMLQGVEPSYQEKNLIKSQIKYHSGKSHFEVSEEASVYQRFSHDLLLHHVDSGLVVINKNRNLNGLLFSFMLNLDQKMRKCVYGDKELFWLGQLYAGQTYSIFPIDGGIVGPVVEAANEERSPSVYQICSAQIAHIDESFNLLWTNGGLKTCKIENCANSDFQRDTDYFKGRYKDVSSLEKIYDSPLNMEGLIIPDANDKPWMQIKECSNYIYCATAIKDNTEVNALSAVGEVSLFDKQTSKSLNSIVSVWNGS